MAGDNYELYIVSEDDENRMYCDIIKIIRNQKLILIISI